MRKAVLYIAMSLDGYIADEHGSADWLNGQDMSVENIDTYSVFVRDVDTVIMGWDTYHQIVTELSPAEWIYANLISYVVTHKFTLKKRNLFYGKSTVRSREGIKKQRGEEHLDLWRSEHSSAISSK